MYPNLSYRKKEQGKVPNQASLDTNWTNYLLHDFKGYRVVQFLPSIPVSKVDLVHAVNVKKAYGDRPKFKGVTMCEVT